MQYPEEKVIRALQLKEERRSAGMKNTVENIATDSTREEKKHQERITFK